jgi:hypothetical protein
MFSIFDLIGLTNGSNLGLIKTGECEDDDEDALMKITISVKNQVNEVPKVYHQYQIPKLIYVQFLSYISIRIS